MSSDSGDNRAAAEAAAIFDAVLDPARGERTVSPAQIEADGGLTVDETHLPPRKLDLGSQNLAVPVLGGSLGWSRVLPGFGRADRVAASYRSGSVVAADGRSAHARDAHLVIRDLIL